MTILSTDPLDLLFDDDGDLLIDGDGLHFATGLEGVAQCVGVRLLMFRDEWFLNLDAGIPYYDEILGEKYDEVIVRRRLVEAIVGTPGVIEVLSLSLSFDNSTRKLSVSYKLRTEFGDTEPDTLALGGRTNG